MRVTTVTYVCDGCGDRSENQDFRTDREWGNVNLSLDGDCGTVSSGEHSGGPVKEDYELCFKCCNVVRGVLKSLGANQFNKGDRGMGSGPESEEQAIVRLRAEIAQKDAVIKALKEIIVDSINN